ncbi:hypothetical protein CAPTEDRAFT_229193 [Capitella teleta]|uniref:Serine protease K12H4.7 n=1 Tax=Capitella teleta TaxID=283909 RepID=R7TZ94_CAPTE|nr:hypothetical protein CAPTEDRAFT_229193 [Capitella teleta]|eukprot:ELT98942.1 hypothetical protein CAPTEDRAFT_229193 [Capitella teleta]
MDLMLRLVYLLLLPGFCISLPFFLHGRPKGGFLGLPVGSANRSPPPEKWFTQKLDHFTSSDHRTWSQRFFINDEHYKPGGPVFLMIGGEGAANPEWMVQGQWVQNYAPQFNALCVMLEHRFYGKSHPTKDLKVESLRYLSSEQALADLAAFRVNISESRGLADAKWIAFGGSYPGALSAWFRYKYPHLVYASVSSSAPMLAQLNFKGPKKVAGLEKYFRLCEPIDASDAKDVSNLHDTIAQSIAGVIQYNRDNRAFEGAVGTNITIETICSIMTTKGSKPFESYAKVNSLLLDTYKEKCLDVSYNKTVQELREESWKSEASEGGRQWTYQTCTEFGFYQTSDLTTQPFGQHFPLKFSTEQCADVYGTEFTQTSIQSAVDWTNSEYGGYNITVTRVVFVNGDIDPWHALGITRDLNAHSPAILIKGTAHCANMYPDAPNDLPQLIRARESVKKLLTLWLS